MSLTEDSWSQELTDLEAALIHSSTEPASALSSIPDSKLIRALRLLTPFLGSQPEPRRADELLGGIVEGLVVRPDGLRHVAEWIDSYSPNLTPRRLHRLANRAAWITRSSKHQIEAVESSPGNLWLAWTVLERFRFAFDVDGIKSTLRGLPDRQVEQDGLLTAFQAFVTIRLASDQQAAESSIEHALGHPENSLPWRTSHAPAAHDIIAHAVWLNYALPHQGIVLQRVCDRVVQASGGDVPPVMLFRHAAALRLQGRFDEAIEKAEAALAHLEGSNEFARTFSEQVVRERELCVAGRFMNERNDEADEAISAIRREVELTDRKSLARIIEVVTLFTAVVAFALGGGAVATNPTRSPRDTLIVLAGYGSVLVTFTLVI